MASKTKGLADFRGLHDRSVIAPQRIKAQLDKMAKESPEAWEYEGDFIKLAGVNQTDMGRFRDQFKDHVVDVPGRNAKRVWVATTKAAEKFRQSVG